MVGRFAARQEHARRDSPAREANAEQIASTRRRATATVTIVTGYPITYNDRSLPRKWLPHSRASLRIRRHQRGPRRRGLLVLQTKIPGLFFFVGTRPKNQTADEPRRTLPALLRRRKRPEAGSAALANVRWITWRKVAEPSPLAGEGAEGG